MINNNSTIVAQNIYNFGLESMVSQTHKPLNQCYDS